MSSFSIDCLDKNKTVVGKQVVSVSRDPLDDNCISFLAKNGRVLFTIDTLKKELVLDNSSNDFNKISTEPLARLKINKIKMDYQDNLTFTLDGKKTVFRISGNALEQKVNGKFEPVAVANEPFDVVLPRTLFNDIANDRLTVDAMPFQMFSILDQSLQNDMQVSTFKSKNKVLHLVKANNQLYIARGGKLIPVLPQNAHYYKMGSKSLVGFTLGTGKGIAGKNGAGIGFVVDEQEIDQIAQFVSNDLQNVVFKNADDYNSIDIGYTMVRKPTEATKKMVEPISTTQADVEQEQTQTVQNPTPVAEQEPTQTVQDSTPVAEQQTSTPPAPQVITDVEYKDITGQQALPAGTDPTVGIVAQDGNNQTPTAEPTDQTSTPQEQPDQQDGDNPQPTNSDTLEPTSDDADKQDADATGNNSSQADQPAPQDTNAPADSNNPNKAPAPSEPPKDKSADTKKLNLTSDGCSTIALLLGALLISGVFTSIFAFALFGIFAFMALGTSTLATYEYSKKDKKQVKKKKLSERQKINNKIAKLTQKLDKIKERNNPKDANKIARIEKQIGKQKNKIDILNKKEQKTRLTSTEQASNQNVSDEMVVDNQVEQVATGVQAVTPTATPTIPTPPSRKRKSKQQQQQLSATKSATHEEINTTSSTVYTYLDELVQQQKSNQSSFTKEQVSDIATRVDATLSGICPQGTDVSSFSEADQGLMQEVINFRNSYNIYLNAQRNFAETAKSGASEEDLKALSDDVDLKLQDLAEQMGSLYIKTQERTLSNTMLLTEAQTDDQSLVRTINMHNDN